MRQYQHYIPQTILRRHSDYVKPTRGDYANKQEFDKAKTKEKHRAKVKTIAFASGFSNGQLGQSKCRRTFGIRGMYDEAIEDSLSALEQCVTKIIEAIEADLVAGTRVTVLARPDKNLLRKFIFIMAYRSRKFHQRFHGQEQDYDSNDREQLLAYMHKHGFKTPKDVWLNNIRAFIDVDLDPDYEIWFAWLKEHAYPGDAKWFYKNMTTSYLCFCTPVAVDEEFLLTENAYGIFEGPCSHLGWTDWHTFAPINPRLMIIMRNQSLGTARGLPSALRDALATAQVAAIEAMTSIYEDPLAAHSYLEDLPVGRPTTSYPTVQKMVGDSAPFEFSSKDLFTFKFFRLPSTFVQRIMTIFLEEAMQTETIIYKSEAGLRKAIDSYLETDQPGFKIVTERPPKDGPEILYTDHNGTISSWSTDIPTTLRRPYLEMLERVARQLGSDSHAQYTVQTPRSFTIMPPMSDKFAAKYKQLGKITDVMGASNLRWPGFDDLVMTWVHDCEQAGLICRLRTLTDFVCRERERSVRQSMRRACLDLISTLHPRRVWLHIRLRRAFVCFLEAEAMQSRDMILANLVAEELDGPEDMVIESMFISSNLTCDSEHSFSDARRYQG